MVLIELLFDFKLFLYIIKIVNKSNALNFAQFGVHLSSEKNV